jgi:hypothetical protein
MAKKYTDPERYPKVMIPLKKEFENKFKKSLLVGMKLIKSKKWLKPK